MKYSALIRTAPVAIAAMAIAVCACFFCACDGSSAQAETVTPGFESVAFDGWKVTSTDKDEHVIQVAPKKGWLDTLKVSSLNVTGDVSVYLAADDDLIDPSLGDKMGVGTAILTADTTSFSFVVLGDKSEILEVWLVQWDLPKSSSSVKSSSSEEKSSSSEKAESSSSESDDPEVEESSSSEGEAHVSEDSSSSVEESSNSEDSSSSIENSGESSSSIESSSSVDAQLPGSDFDGRNDYWATTSDAMETDGSATVLGTSYTFSSTASLAENSTSIMLTTQEVSCKWTIITGGWKVASGIYFNGTYAGSDARDIYAQGYTSGTPTTGASDLTQDMTFGKPFTARPTAFELTYSYTHVANSNSDYPQKSLAYVILVSSDNKAVALGAITDGESVEETTKVVALNYGSDPDGILTAGYAGTSDLSLGTGDEDVASIRVLFQSSAYAHIVAGGAAGSSGNYRGGVGSALTLENFKLIYGETTNEN